MGIGKSFPFTISTSGQQGDGMNQTNDRRAGDKMADISSHLDSNFENIGDLRYRNHGWITGYVERLR